MTIQKTWNASSKFEQTEKGEDLFYLAGRWGVGIDVRITRPFLYSQMSVIKKKTGEAIPEKTSLPSSIPTHTAANTPGS